MLYMVREGHLDTARDIMLVMLVNKCASHHAPCKPLSHIPLVYAPSALPVAVRFSLAM